MVINMKKNFRSRGIRFLKKEPGFKCKIYYEMEERLLDAYPVLREYVDKGILAMFEYSEDADGNLDSINFHNNLLEQTECLYEKLRDDQRKLIESIPGIYGMDFRNYTTGYRIKDNKICGVSYYFYRTAWKETRYGMRGITDPQERKECIGKFIKNQLNSAERTTIEEVRYFASLMEKLKGFSISFGEERVPEYKLYARLTEAGINSLRSENPELGAVSSCYGQTVLTAQRIRNYEVSGYNFYYLR